MKATAQTLPGTAISPDPERPAPAQGVDSSISLWHPDIMRTQKPKPVKNE